MYPAIPPPVVQVVAYAPKAFCKYNSKGEYRVLESHEVWTKFEEISSIYRESGHNEEISEYLKKQLTGYGFDVEQKKDGTICASRCLNSAKDNAIILQAHMDMVGISADGNSKKAIKMHVKDGWLYANDRTLGADDGLGVAAILAVAQNPKFKEIPLEMIVTTNEETGMDGARNLIAEDFQGKYLINLDSEESGIIIKGCAGINQFSLDEKIKTQALQSDGYEKVTVKLSGARGGHSATIKQDSLIPLEILLPLLKDTQNLKLVSLSSGERYNAIPRNAELEFLIPKADAEIVVEALKKYLSKTKEENCANNPNFDFSIDTQDAVVGTKYVQSELQAKIVDALEEIPTGLMSKFSDNESTKTSQNLGVLKIADGSFHIQIMGRSADKKEGEELRDTTAQILSKLFDKTIKTTDSTPIWQPKPESLLEKVAVDAFCELNSSVKPIVKVEHGGLESAIFTQKNPNLEQISIGPTIEEPHSIQERVKIDTVVPFYEWLSLIIEKLK